jgi:HD-GYP domain-containing protein (c-di-GMP phosphodiesterase class II)
MATRIGHVDRVDYGRLEAAYRRSLRRADDLRQLYAGLQRSVARSLIGLAGGLEAREPFSRGHGARVAALSRRIAIERTLDADTVAAIEQAALLHDIGTIAVPDAMLRKPGALAAAEWEHVRQHPIVGAQIVAPFDFFAEIVPLIRHHHERWDGSGYPDGLVGVAIPLGARIIAAADLFDALTSSRPYRAALAPADALRCLDAAAERALDPDIVDASRRAIRGDD